MKSETTTHVRGLITSDLHQSRLLYAELAEAVERHKPDMVALVGDVLDFAQEFSKKRQFTVAECANRLAALPAPHLIFVRGNHKDRNWSDFVAAWPHGRRELNAVYGSAYTVGSLVVVGFRHKMSAAGRASIAAAVRARWAKVKGAKKTVEPAQKPKRKMSAAGRAKIAAAAKARWKKAKGAT